MSSEDTVMGSSKKGPAMEWMYKPTALVDREDYLLGRTVDKSLKMLDEAEKGNAFSYADEVEKDRTPISIFAKPAGPAAGPVDLIKKIKEDPLYQIHKKEEENLKQLLKNPVRMKQLREMADLRESGSSSRPSLTPSSESKSKDKSKKQSKHKKKQSKKKKKRRSSSSDSDDSSSESEGDVVKSAKAVTSFQDLDRLLSEKLLSLKDKAKEKSKKEDSKSTHKTRDRIEERDHQDLSQRPAGRSEPEPERSHRDERRDYRDHDRHRDDRNDDRNRYRHERTSNHEREDRRSGNHRDRDRDEGRSGYRARSRSPRDRSKNEAGPSGSADKRKAVLDEAALERKRMEMMENAKWRDVQRTKNVTKYREEQQKEEEKNKRELDPDFIRKQLMEAATTGSVEKRIKSNSYNIQKSKSAMNMNFARR